MRALEEALENFAGCARDHQPRPLVPRPPRHAHPGVRGRQQVVWFEGNYSEYEADKRRRMGADAEIPKRIKYRALTRA